MSKKTNFTIFCILLFNVSCNLVAQKLLQETNMQDVASDHSVSAAIPKKVLKKGARKKYKYSFKFSDKPLTELINEIASILDINIILPQGATAIPANLKINMNQEKALNMTQAWKELLAILEIAGYIVISDGDFIEIQKLDKNSIRNPVRVYVDIATDNIPDTQELVRTIFYLQNINVKANWADYNNMLRDILSPTADIRTDNKTNAIILTDKAANIRVAMRIIQELDKAGTRDMIEVLPLYYVSAQLVDDLFNKQLLANRQPSVPGQPPVQMQDQATYFPKHTKVLALGRNNSLVVMGTSESIDLVKDFIIKYLDRPPESGESILHLYDLQYLNAQEFAPILQNILNPGQMTQAAGKTITGPKQYFQDVIVQPELSRKSKEIAPTVTPGMAVGAAQPISEGANIGGNRLIIAARKKDWVRIKQLIDDLDQPQLQVALEVLIVDVTLNRDRLLGNQLRNKAGFNNSISDNVDFQTAHLSQPILKSGVETGFADGSGFGATERPPDALAANLLQLGDPFEATANLASTREAGSLIIALNDSQNQGVWSVWQLLNKYTTNTILAQPFLITKNHKQATVSVAQQRFLQGSADTSNIAPKISFEWVTAALTVDILPHISSSNNVNLQVVINVNEFINQDANTRATRLIQTNANVGNGQILALGGLTRTRENMSKNKTPLLADFPVFGWWFKQNRQIKERNNLLIFISPTIIAPRADGGIDKYTKTKLDLAKNSLNKPVDMENLKDPITRWFFKPDPCLGEKTIDEYTATTLSDRYDNSPIQHINFAQANINAHTNSLAQAEISQPTQDISQKNEVQLKKLLASADNPLLPADKLQTHEQIVN